VSKDLVCDSDNACADSSDEKNCKCFTTQFECPTEECLQVNQLCDSGNDCDDKTDESRCGKCKLSLDGHICQFFFFLNVIYLYFQEKAALKIASPVPEEDVFHCRLHVMETKTVKMGRMSLPYVVCMLNSYVVCALLNVGKCIHVLLMVILVDALSYN